MCVVEKFSGNIFTSLHSFSIDMSSALSIFKVDLLLQAAEVLERNDSTGIATVGDA